MNHQIIEIIPTDIRVAKKNINSANGELARVVISCTDGIERQAWPKIDNLDNTLSHFVVGKPKHIRASIVKNDDGSELHKAAPAKTSEVLEARKAGPIPPAPPMPQGAPVAAPVQAVVVPSAQPSPPGKEELAIAALEGTIKLIELKEISISGLETSVKKLYRILSDIVTT